LLLRRILPLLPVPLLPSLVVVVVVVVLLLLLGLQGCHALALLLQPAMLLALRCWRQLDHRLLRRCRNCAVPMAAAVLLHAPCGCRGAAK
jgi:hypothetical protein